MAKISRDTVKNLLQWNGDVLSLYLMVDPGYEENQAATPAWQIWLKNVLSAIEKNLDESQRKTWNLHQERLDALLDAYVPAGKTLVLFLGLEDEQTFELPVRLENHYGFGQPLITPLLWAMDEYQNYLIVRAHRDKAEFLHAYLGQGSTSDTLNIDLDYDWGEKTLMPATSYGRNMTQGSQRDAYEDMIDAHIKRFYKDIARRTEELAVQHGVGRIILGGSEQAAHSVRDHLTQAADQMVIGVVSIPQEENTSDVIRRVQPVAEAYERRGEADLLDEIIGLAKADGRGVLGREGVLKAIENQQVELILAPWPMEDETLLQELPLKALTSGSRIELVHGEVADHLKEEGGIAARLYYTITA